MPHNGNGYCFPFVTEWACDTFSDKETKTKEIEDAANKLLKEQKALDEHEKLMSGCKADIEKGLEWVLTLTNPRRNRF